MNLPRCVVNCKDPALKQKAIAMFTRGGNIEQVDVVIEIMTAETNNDQGHIKPREDSIKQFMEYYSSVKLMVRKREANSVTKSIEPTSTNFDDIPF